VLGFFAIAGAKRAMQVADSLIQLTFSVGGDGIAARINDL